MNKVYHIALVTFRESIRSKVLYSVLFFSGVLVLVSAIFGSVTIGDRVKVIKDFGLMSVSFFSVAFAVISGASLLHKELNFRTIFNVLSKPVSRGQFLLGKHIGMFVTTAAIAALMTIALAVFAWCFEGQFDPLLCYAACYVFLELLIVTAATIFFSTIVITPSLSGLFSFSVFLAGRCSSYILSFISNEGISGFAEVALLAIYWLLPHVDLMTVSNQVVYGQTMPAIHLCWSALYCIAYAGILLCCASMFFRLRDFN